MRPDHARLTSSAYLLGSGSQGPSKKTYEDADAGRAYGKIGNGRPGQSFGGEHGAHDPSEPLVGMEAVRLGSSFFVFGMLIGKSLSTSPGNNWLSSRLSDSHAIQCGGRCSWRVRIAKEIGGRSSTDDILLVVLSEIKRPNLLF